jgi:ferredoxin
MALRINQLCVNCWACEPLCPNKAIYATQPYFLIDPMKCTECAGDYDDPQCAAICPIEGAILDDLGLALNPPGSLTGIAPDRLAQARAELRSH